MIPRLALGLAGALCYLTSANAQSVSITPPSKDNAPQICTSGHLDSGKLLEWYYYNNASIAKSYSSPEALQRSFLAPDAEQGEKQTIVSKIAGQMQVRVGLSDTGFQPNVPVSDVNIDSFLAGTAPTLTITCAQAAANSPAPAAAQPAKTISAWGTSIRLRGTSDGLVAPANSTAYTSAPGATLSYSENGPTKTTATATQAAIGVAFSFPSATQDQHWPPASDSTKDIIPFVSIDRSISDVAGKQSTSSRENVSLGLVGDITAPFAFSNGRVGANVLSGTYYHLWDDINDSQLNYLHFVDQPVLNGLLNDYFFVPCCSVPVDKTWFAASLLFDLRGDLGEYDNRGTNPALNVNYKQFGTDLGAAISLEPIKSDITVSETYLAQLQQQRPTISLFQVAWTYAIIGKNLGLTASYQNGRLEATAQATQQWLISLSAKY